MSGNLKLIKMKKLAYALLLFCLAFAACEKNEVEEQEKNQAFTPRVFNETALFPENIDSVRVLSIGQSYNFTGLQFSPAGKAAISWKVNDQEVSTAESYAFTATEGGSFRVKLDVSYNGTKTSRFRDIFVIPNTYTKKNTNFVVMSYLTENGKYTDVNWDATTHLAYKVATLTTAGALDVSKGEAVRKAEEIVGRAHLKGIPVLLGISGALSGDGWSVSSSNQFGAVIADATKRAALVQSVKNYVTAKKMDGVDIMMTDINTASATITTNVLATGTFLNDLRTALGPNAILTVTVTTNTYHTRYPDLSTANWLNVHAFEDGLTVGPGATLGQPSSFNYMVAGANLWMAKFPANKLVVGIPAFGLRYVTLDANGKNLSWTSFNYMPYKDIIAAVPTAGNAEFTSAIAKGVYYNGVPLVTQKAAYLKANGFLGAYVWAADYDVIGATSLTTAIFNSLK
jgi:hypothetical protein